MRPRSKCDTGEDEEELIFVLVLISPAAKHLQSSCQTSRGQLFLNGYETRAEARIRSESRSRLISQEVFSVEFEKYVYCV